MTFKVGDKVRIKRDSKFIGQNNHWGTIIYSTGDMCLPHCVLFSDGYKNSYGEIDLEKVEKTPFKKEEMIL